MGEYITKVDLQVFVGRVTTAIDSIIASMSTSSAPTATATAATTVIAPAAAVAAPPAAPPATSSLTIAEILARLDSITAAPLAAVAIHLPAKSATTALPAGTSPASAAATAPPPFAAPMTKQLPLGSDLASRSLLQDAHRSRGSESECEHDGGEEDCISALPVPLLSLLGKMTRPELTRIEIRIRAKRYDGGISTAQVSSLLHAAAERKPAELIFDVGCGNDDPLLFELPCFPLATAMNLQIWGPSFSLSPPAAGAFVKINSLFSSPPGVAYTAPASWKIELATPASTVIMRSYKDLQFNRCEQFFRAQGPEEILSLRALGWGPPASLDGG